MQDEASTTMCIEKGHTCNELHRMCMRPKLQVDTFLDGSRYQLRYQKTSFIPFMVVSSELYFWMFGNIVQATNRSKKFLREQNTK